ncbi:hypothetical protein Tco_1061602 [Tanacetum coccineum]
MLSSALLCDGRIVIPTLVVMKLSCLLKEQLLEPALNLTVHCCGLEFRVLNGYDQNSFDEERGLNCVVQTSFDEERGLNCVVQTSLP